MSTIAVAHSGLLGDAVSSLPAILALSEDLKGKNEKLYLIHVRRDVLDLAPNQDNIVALGELSHIGVVPDLDNAKFVTLSASKAWQAGIWSLHMAQAHMKYLGLPITSPRINLQFNHTETKKYDFIVSPYSRSDDNNNKKWPYQRWAVIIDYLRAKGFSIGVLGTSEDEQKFTDVDYIFDKSLPEVCSYIKNIKRAFLSIDAGPSHLCHNIGTPHFLLYPKCLPKTWVANTNDNCVILQDEPLNIQVETVIEIIKENWLD